MINTMSHSLKNDSGSQALFWLNPNVVAHMTNGFKALLSRPIQISEPEPEFASTVPGDLATLPEQVDVKEWH